MTTHLWEAIKAKHSKKCGWAKFLCFYTIVPQHLQQQLASTVLWCFDILHTLLGLDHKMYVLPWTNDWLKGCFVKYMLEILVACKTAAGDCVWWRPRNKCLFTV